MVQINNLDMSTHPNYREILQNVLVKPEQKKNLIRMLNGYTDQLTTDEAVDVFSTLYQWREHNDLDSVQWIDTMVKHGIDFKDHRWAIIMAEQALLDSDKDGFKRCLEVAAPVDLDFMVRVCTIDWDSDQWEDNCSDLFVHDIFKPSECVNILKATRTCNNKLIGQAMLAALLPKYKHVSTTENLATTICLFRKWIQKQNQYYHNFKLCCNQETKQIFEWLDLVAKLPKPAIRNVITHC